MMKIAAICLLLVAVVYADVEKTDDDFTAVEDLTESARFAFITVNSDGSVSFTFNATSLQYTLLAALTALVLAAILLPLLGLIGIGKGEPDYSYAYVDQTGYTAPSYQATGTNYGYSKR